MKRFRKARRSLLLFLIAGFLLQSSATAQNRKAFLVGTDSYDHLPESAQLSVAVKDARLLSDTLKGLQPAFDVTLITDGKRSEIGIALLDFMEKSRGAECVLFYFAGHGIEFHGANYLLASDSNLNFGTATVPESKRLLEQKAIHLEKVIEMLSKTDANITVAILDACRDNPIEGDSASLVRPDEEGSLSPSGSNSTGEPVKRIGHVTAPSGMIISYAADVGQSANDGLFTGILAKNMKIPGRSIMEVFAATRMTVRDQSQSLRAENQGVAHEPAEYCKLDLEGLQFSFLPVDGTTIGNADTATSEKPVPLSRGAVSPNSVTGAGDDHEVVSDWNGSGRDLTSALKDTITPEEIEKAYSALRGTPPAGTHGRGERREIGGIRMSWCAPTGESGFVMGSPPEEENRNGDERQRNVILTRGFWLAQTECTLQEWHRNGGKLRPRDERESPLWPVEGKSFEEVANYFTSKTGAAPLPPGWSWSLPTEAQWEYACRAGGDESFGNSDQISNRLENFRATDESNLIPRLYEVASRSSNRWGFYDMLGNVREWCLDWYSENPTGLVDPAGPPSGTSHVIRGGKFTDYMPYCRAARRSPRYPDERAGFRQAIVFSSDSLLQYRKRQENMGLINLTAGTVFGVGIGDDIDEVRKHLVEQGLFTEEKKDGKIVSLLTRNCILRSHNSPICNEIWTGSDKIMLSNGLRVGSDLEEFDEKLGPPYHIIYPQQQPERLQKVFRAGLLRVIVTVDKTNPRMAKQLTIRPLW